MIDLKIGDITEDTLYYIKSFVETYPNENEIKLNIDSNGGEVKAALAIYDYLRLSGKTVYCNAGSNCHSAAIIVLLAAPLENRSCNPHTTALIHNVYGFVRGDFSPEELQKMTDSIKAEKEKIAAVYADRTNLSFEESLSLMNEEIERDAEWLLNNGFVGNINIFISNMKKNIILKIMNLLKNSYDVLDAEGIKLFTAESAELEVGMEAEPDGEYIVPEIGKVTITDGVIVSIEPEVIEEHQEEVIEEEVVNEEPEEEIPTEEPEVPEIDEEKEELKKEIEILKSDKAALEAKVEELLAEIEILKKEKEEQVEALNEAVESIKELKNRIKSNYVPEQRVTNYKTESFDDYKENFKKIFNK